MPGSCRSCDEEFKVDDPEPQFAGLCIGCSEKARNNADSDAAVAALCADGQRGQVHPMSSDRLSQKAPAAAEYVVYVPFGLARVVPIPSRADGVLVIQLPWAKAYVFEDSVERISELEYRARTRQAKQASNRAMQRAPNKPKKPVVSSAPTADVTSNQKTAALSPQAQRTWRSVPLLWCTRVAASVRDRTLQLFLWLLSLLLRVLSVNSASHRQIAILHDWCFKQLLKRTLESHFSCAVTLNDIELLRHGALIKSELIGLGVMEKCFKSPPFIGQGPNQAISFVKVFQSIMSMSNILHEGSHLSRSRFEQAGIHSLEHLVIIRQAFKVLLSTMAFNVCSALQTVSELMRFNLPNRKLSGAYVLWPSTDINLAFLCTLLWHEALYDISEGSLLQQLKSKVLDREPDEEQHRRLSKYIGQAIETVAGLMSDKWTEAFPEQMETFGQAVKFIKAAVSDIIINSELFSVENEQQRKNALKKLDEKKHLRNIALSQLQISVSPVIFVPGLASYLDISQLGTNSLSIDSSWMKCFSRDSAEDTFTCTVDPYAVVQQWIHDPTVNSTRVYTRQPGGEAQRERVYYFNFTAKPVAQADLVHDPLPPSESELAELDAAEVAEGSLPASQQNPTHNINREVHIRNSHRMMLGQLWPQLLRLNTDNTSPAEYFDICISGTHREPLGIQSLLPIITQTQVDDNPELKALLGYHRGMRLEEPITALQEANQHSEWRIYAHKLLHMKHFAVKNPQLAAQVGLVRLQVFCSMVSCVGCGYSAVQLQRQLKILFPRALVSVQVAAGSRFDIGEVHMKQE